MTDAVYVVTGASGHVGGEIARALRLAGRRVRVIGRSAERLKPLTSLGAEPLVGDLEDATFVKRAFQGATAAFVMVPPNMALQKGFRDYQNRVFSAQADAVVEAGVKHVATLSSIGAHLSQGAGPVNGLYDMEQRFNGLAGVNVLHLRPGYFMENHLSAIGSIKGMGSVAGAVRSDLPMAMIATRDIAQVAARRLLELDFQGKTVLELMGPKDITMEDVSRAIGAAIGRADLRYVQLPYEQVQQALVGMGVPVEMAALYMEMTRGFNDRTIKPTQPRSAQTTTPTTIDVFAREVFAPAFNAS